MYARAIVIGIAVVLLASVAYYIGTNRSRTETTTTATTTPQAQLDPLAVETSADLIGTWQSSDDSNYVRTFSADGTVTDAYEGEASATSTGTWTVFTSAMQKPESVTFPLDADVAYIRVLMDDDAYHYRVSSVTANKLEVIYMDRGGMLRFSRTD